MQDLKLISLLKTLTVEEFRRLGKFLNSPFYNYSNPPVLLYKSLKRFHPSFDSPKLTQQNIWNKVFPNEPFQSSKFWQLTSKLAQMVEQFLINIELEARPENGRRLLMQSFIRRDKDLFKKEKKEIEKKLEEKKDGVNSFVKEKLLHLQSISNYQGLFDTTEAIQYEEENLEFLDLFYLSQKLKTAINLKSAEKHRNRSYSFHFIKDITELIESDKMKEEHRYLRVFSKLFELVNGGDSNLYSEIKNSFFDSIDRFNREDTKFVFIQLLNYTINQSNKGIKKFRLEVFKTYKDCLKLGLLIENGRMTKDTFLNIVITGTSLEKFKWIENFIQQYSNNLDDSIKNDCQVLGNGYLLFMKKEYSATIDILIHFQFTQKRNMLRAKGLLIRSYFELFLTDRSYFDLFHSYANSYDKYLKRDNVESKTRLSLYINFIKHLKKLASTINQNKWNPKFKDRFSKRILTEEFHQKPWLIKKLESL